MVFSVLIAHYNNFSYFKQCYNSLLHQTFQDFEIILVDDCSTDNSLAEIKKLTEKYSRVKIFNNAANLGVGYTKKKCAEFATGQFCGFVDPDDALMPKAIEKSIKAYSNKSIVATYSQIIICNENLEPQKKFPNTRKIKNNNPLFFNVNFEASHFFTFRREIYLKTEGICGSYKVAEDMDIYLKLYEKGILYFINEPLYLYRIHPAGLSHNQAKTDLKNKTWHTVLLNAVKRRGLKKLYGENINTIESLPKFLHQKQNTWIHKLLRKLSW